MEIDDDYNHVNESIEYILENQLFPSDGSDSYKILSNSLDFALANSCDCSEFDCSNSNKCNHGGNYQMNPKFNELTLNKDRRCHDLIYECSTLCNKCPLKCSNRLLQFGPRKKLKIINVHQQFGLTTLIPIPLGGFVCEYVGEILTKEEAERRTNLNEANGDMNYIICLNESPIKNNNVANENNDENHTIQTFIDPSRKGNIGRYLNHSCDPNCEILSVRLDSVQPKLGIFTVKDVDVGEELCFDYGAGGSFIDDDSNKEGRKECFCGTVKCRGYLPNFKF